MTKKKIAILGGGLGGLSAAYALTSRPFWQRHYDITLYQLGWRLGGKCASSRQASEHDRNLEHGLHVWLGCYHNSFRMLRDCYEHSNWQERSSLGTVDKAVTAQNEVPCMDYLNGQWYFWPLRYPKHPGKPGNGFLGSFSLWHGARETLGAVADQHSRYRDAAKLPDVKLSEPPGALAAHINSDKNPIDAAHELARSMPVNSGKHKPGHHQSLLWLLDESKANHQASYDESPPKDPFLHRMWVMVDLGIAIVRGLIADDVLLRGPEAIDHWEFRAWLREHGAHDATLYSGLVRELYDAGFSYRNGVTGTGIKEDWGNAELAAGVAIYCTFHVSINYSGSVCYELNAGMGEVVIAPLYSALEDAGVKFEFFQNVRKLKLDNEQTGVDEIHIGQQVKLKNGTYQPLDEHPANGIPTWPDAPFKEQIEDGSSLGNVNLESFWSGWQDASEKVLKRGQHFDHVVLAISIAGLPSICSDMVKATGAVGEKWRLMFDKVKTTQTQSAELWLDRTLDQTGWDGGAVPVDAGPEPYDVWADMDKVMKTESWPADGPKSLNYLCGPLPGSFLDRPPEDTEVPDLAAAEVNKSLTQWLESNAHALWPNLRDADGNFDWNALYDPKGRHGSERLKAQYLRANIDPSERYVLSLPGSSKHRMHAGDTLLDNLVVAGDWAHTPFNAGNVEASVMSGLAASDAIADRCEKFWSRTLGDMEAWLWKHGLWSRRSRIGRVFTRWKRKGVRALF